MRHHLLIALCGLTLTVACQSSERSPNDATSSSTESTDTESPDITAVSSSRTAGIVGTVVFDDAADTDPTYGGIDRVEVHREYRIIRYSVYVPGLREYHEITGGVDANTYFNNDGITIENAAAPCDEFTIEADYTQNVISVAVPVDCLPQVSTEAVTITLLSLDPHEPGAAIYRIADDVIVEP